MALKRKGWRTVLKMFGALVLMAAVLFGLIVIYVCVQEGKVPHEVSGVETDYDAIIVLGAQVRPDGTPSVQLSWRLDRAAEVWNMKKVPVIVCGARGKDEPEAEAYAMKRYLEDAGIQPEMILTDPESFNTEQNLRNAKELLAGHTDQASKVIIVTSDYHVPRAMAMARDLGLDAAGIGSPCLPEYWIKNHGREALAWCKYWLNKYLHLRL